MLGTDYVGDWPGMACNAWEEGEPSSDIFCIIVSLETQVQPEANTQKVERSCAIKNIEEETAALLV